MKILVTGGAGFVGSNLCRLLLKEGHQVWAVDNLLTGRHENLNSLTSDPKFRFVICGVETPQFLEVCKEIEGGFDQIYHLACPTGVPNIEILGEEMLRVCSVGTQNVLTVAREHGSRLVFTSSSEVYGNPEVTPQSESYTGNVDPTGWRANYEEGKRFSETWVMLFVKKYNVHASIVRLFNVYGPNMSSADFRVVPRFITQALSGTPLTVHGDGTQERTMCYIDDLLEGLTLVMDKGVPGEVYNLGSDQSISMIELAKKVLLTVGITHTPRAVHDHESRMPVLDKMRALGWEPRVPLEEGLKRTIEDFRARVKENTVATLIPREQIEEITRT